MKEMSDYSGLIETKVDKWSTNTIISFVFIFHSKKVIDM